MGKKFVKILVVILILGLGALRQLMTSMWRSKPSAAVVIMSLSAFVCV